MRKKKSKKGGRNKLADEKEILDEQENKEQETQKKEAAAEKNIESEAGEPEKTEEEKLKEQLDAANDKYLRLMAEYDNFRKRSAKERLEITDTAKGNAVSEILPVFDNFERALEAETTDETYKQGVEMIFKQFGDCLKKLGVEIIDPTGEVFDPNIANAVNQIEDPELGENIVAQTFQKGYKIGDKVIRYAMVVVANP
ncbi:MAG: nucleotide exchange factor GrpE [Ruminococcus sp.]